MEKVLLCQSKDSTKTYIEFVFANHCMPTLVKLKPASIVSFMKKDINSTVEFQEKLGKELINFDASYEILYENQSAYCVLIYNQVLLNEIFMKYSNHPIMKNNGYSSGYNDFSKNLSNFKDKFIKYKSKKRNGFPHEAGILLGYPIVDVEEFIKNHGKDYILCSYWKVYHNVEEALKTFQCYTDIRNKAMYLLFSGTDLCEFKLSI